MKKFSKLAVEIGFIVIMAVILMKVFPFLVEWIFNVIANLVAN